jgi:hypothetical protein
MGPEVLTVQNEQRYRADEDDGEQPANHEGDPAPPPRRHAEQHDYGDHRDRAAEGNREAEPEHRENEALQTAFQASCKTRGCSAASRRATIDQRV